MGLRRAAEDMFKVDTHNGDLEEKRKKKKSNWEFRNRRKTICARNNKKQELKEYMKEAVQYRDVPELVKNIRIFCTWWGLRIGKPKMDWDVMFKYAGIWDDSIHRIQLTTGKIGSKKVKPNKKDYLWELPREKTWNN